MKQSEFAMIEQPARGQLNAGLSFGYVDVPATIREQDRPFLNTLTDASMDLQRQIRKPIPLETRDLEIETSQGKIPARIYLPEGNGPFPLVLHYHGGGFAIRDIDCFDWLSRRYASGAGAVVLTIGYDLTPERRFPVQAEEAYDALLWAREHAAEYGADPLRDVVMGDSAGGNLSAVISLMCRDRGQRVPARMIPCYPVVDARPDVQRESDWLYGTGFNLDYKHLLSYNAAYAPEDAENPYVSPLLADLAGLPPCRMVSAQCDILLDSGLEFIRRLREAGVEAEYRIYKGVPHDFLFYGFPESYEAYDLICGWIREV